MSSTTNGSSFVSSATHMGGITGQLRKWFDQYMYGKTTKFGSQNFGGGITGRADTASGTEFKGSKRSHELHAKMLGHQNTVAITDDRAAGLKACLERVLASGTTPPELVAPITAFLTHEGPMIGAFTDNHVKQDNKAGRPPHAHGASSDTTTPVEELYGRHSSPEVVALYTGPMAGLWLFDVYGIWLREVDYSTFRDIVEESPLVGITSLMTTQILLAKWADADFIEAQEMPRGDEIDDLLRQLGWSIIRHEESTAFLYKTAAVVLGEHPMPMSCDTTEILTVQQFYEQSKFDFEDYPKETTGYVDRLRDVKKSPGTDTVWIDGELKGLKRSTAGKLKKERGVIEKATRRTQFVTVGPRFKVANIHWTQPKTDQGYAFQHAYFKYLLGLGFIVAGDTNTARKKIAMLKAALGDQLLGDHELATSDKTRTEVATHGQFILSEKAGVKVSDPKTQVMVPASMVSYHTETHLVSDGPVGTKLWPSDHAGKVSTFRGLKF